MPLADLDFWLIDRVFQPACVRLRRFGTCFDFCRTVASGIIVFHLASLALAVPEPLLNLSLDVPAALMPLAVAGGILRIVRRIEANLPAGAANPLRLDPGLTAWRMAFGAFTLAGGTWWCAHGFPSSSNIFFGMADLLWPVLLALLVCTPCPPSPAAREALQAAGVPQGA